MSTLMYKQTKRSMYMKTQAAQLHVYCQNSDVTRRNLATPLFLLRKFRIVLCFDLTTDIKPESTTAHRTQPLVSTRD